MNTQKTVIFENDKAVMSFEDYLSGWRAVCEMRQFLEDNWNTADEDFQAEVFKAAIYYLCRSFPHNQPVDVDANGFDMDTLQPLSKFSGSKVGRG